ncbi:hypothetical protein OROHE_017800 [Orobanche hederae]
MDKEGNYSGNFPGLDYNSLEVQTHHHHHNMYNNKIVDYVLNNPPPTTHDQPNICSSSSLDRLSFADVMQFAGFGSKLDVNHSKATAHEEETGNIDPVYFLKFPVLNDHHIHHHHKLQDDDDDGDDDHQNHLPLINMDVEGVGGGDDHDEVNPVEEKHNMSVQLRFLSENLEKSPNSKGKKKRPRSIKTSEEVESQRMTHIAVERNRRKQMNEHLRVLRALMPSSYVQRGDQASIIGGAIEFVRELEQLLQCLESQKRRRFYGDAGQRPVGDPSSMVDPPNSQPTSEAPLLMIPPPMPHIPNNEQMNNIVEETAESKSCLADVQVKLLGFDAVVKVLSRRRPGQLIQAIAALEDMQLNILHTNITTIEQTVLYSFNVKIGGEARLTAEDMAKSVQQIFSFIHTSSSI